MTGQASPLLLLACAGLGLAAVVAKAVIALRDLPEPPSLELAALPDVTLAYGLPRPLDLADYQALLDRSPFGGVPPPPVAADLPVDEPLLKPVAIITAPGRHIVLLEAEGGDEAEPLIRATVGDEVDGRRILEITAKELVLEGPDGEVEVVRLRPKRGRDDDRLPLIEAVKPGQRNPEPTVAPERAPAPPDDLNRNLPIWTTEALGQLVSTQSANDAPR